VSKVTSKLQITPPKAFADHLGIKPGDEIDWQLAADVVWVIRVTKRRAAKNRSLRLRFFDWATRRQKERQKALDPALVRSSKAGFGWTQESLYLCGESGRR
jgi:bifunctional DNA-binding transcriptional regulator/antitoxin component of YhaV-PrlF toxin-antitoxin module